MPLDPYSQINEPNVRHDDKRDQDPDLILTPCAECKEEFQHHLLRRHETSGCLLCEICFSEYLEAYDETETLFI